MEKLQVVQNLYYGDKDPGAAGTASDACTAGPAQKKRKGKL